MAGGELLGGHPILGALAGAYLGNKMEKKHKRRKHEREELFYESETEQERRYGGGYY